jgi:putative salt-induced outer membrane protein YdiY
MKKLFSLTIVISIIYYFPLFAQVNTERFRQDVDTTGFSGLADIEAVIATGNTDFQLINLGGRVNYNWGDDYTFFVSDGGYGWESGKAFTDQLFAHLRHVITTGKILQIEFFTQFDNNKKRLLTARELIGGGLRFRLVKSDIFKLRLGAGYMFENEYYDLPENSIHPTHANAHRLTSYLTYTLEFNKTLSFISTGYYQPDFAEWNDYKIISENALLISSGSFIDFYIKFNLRHDSKPPDTIKNLDTISKIGLSFKFSGK